MVKTKKLIQKRFVMTIRTKVILGFACVFAVLVVTVALNLYQISLTQKYSKALQKSDVPVTLATAELSREVNSSAMMLHAWIVTQNPSYQQAFRSSWGEIQALRIQIDRLGEDWLRYKSIALWSTIKKQLDQLYKVESSLIEQQGISTAAATKQYYSQVIPKIEKIQGLFGSAGSAQGHRSAKGLLVEQERLLEANSASFIRVVDVLRVNQWGILAFAALITVVIVMVTIKLITDPLRKAIAIADALAAGKRDVDIESQRSDEAGKLLHALFEMQNSIKVTEDKLRANEEDLQDLLQQLQSRAADYRDMLSHVASGDLTRRVETEGDDVLSELGDFLNSTTQSLSDITRVIASTIQKMSGNITHMRDAVDLQASSASEQSDAVMSSAEMINKVKLTSKDLLIGATDLSRVSENTRTESQKGQQVVFEAAESMSLIRQDVGGIADSIITLSERIHKIAEITAAVNTLAERSRLLALNASIEAAKAGEAGKGFAIVAAEVKELADQSQNATMQVQSILNEIEQATSEAVRVSEQGQKGVDKGIALVETSGHVIKKLSVVIDDASLSNKNMANTIQQEAELLDEIVNAMDRISRSTEKVLQSTQLTSKVATQFSEISEQLTKNIKRYKFDHEDESLK